MKDSIIKFRVSEVEKENLNEIISILGEKNTSSFFRNIINDLSSVMIYKQSNVSELNLLLEKYNELAEDKSLTVMQRHSLKQKINLLNHFKEEIKDFHS